MLFFIIYALVFNFIGFIVILRYFKFYSNFFLKIKPQEAILAWTQYINVSIFLGLINFQFRRNEYVLVN